MKIKIFIPVIFIFYLLIMAIYRPHYQSENKDVIHIAFAIDNQYSPYLATTMASILNNTKSPINFYVFNNGISDENQKKLLKLRHIRPFDVKFIFISEKSRFLSSIKNSSGNYITNITNTRLLSASLLPNLDKVIFLDADLVVLQDIKKLWDIDIGNTYMAAAKDPAFPIFYREFAEKFELPDKYSYVNTGVTVYNLAKWRQNNIEQKFLGSIVKFGSFLQYPDQDILNISLAPDVFYLPKNYNILSLPQSYKCRAPQDAFIVHFAGWGKPWLYDVQFSQYFWKYAKQTPYFWQILYTYCQQRFLSFIDSLR